ncbi:MAG: hypothetical protein CMJ85_01970 [Planctomycetes bacterium]|jgi:hypothetical protein|nr:hypothetical protein [Planctomycetota bacterium]
MVLAAGAVLFLVGQSSSAGTDPAEAVSPVEIEEAPPPAFIAAEERSTIATWTDRADTRPSQNPTSGSIDGTVQVLGNLVGSLQDFHILLEEAVNTAGSERNKDGPRRGRRFQKKFQLRASGRGGSFRFDTVPFSKYGWRVAAFAPEVNGQDSLVMLDAKNLRKEVFLTLKPAQPLHVVIKDQDRLPVAKVPITLRPIGRPYHRGVVHGKTDAYGLLLRDKVIGGLYRIVIGPEIDPFLKAREINVGTQEMHFEQVQLPRGGSLKIRVLNPAGYGIVGANIEAIARDSKIYKKVKTKTDRSGIAKLHYLKPGKYSVHVIKKGFGRGYEDPVVTDKQATEVTINLRYVLK